jgi:hypothetical protein
MKCVASNKKLSSEIRKETTDTNVHTLLVSFASVLTDKYGYGKEKTMQILKSVFDRADSIVKGYCKIEDLETVLKEEYDIVFVPGERPNGRNTK